MEFVRLVEGYRYELPEQPTPLEERFALVVEVLARLQQLDQKHSSGEMPAGLRLINRLSTLARQSPNGQRAYSLLLDVMAEQQSLTESFDTLGKRRENRAGKPCSRQSEFQNTKADVELIKSVWPEVGAVLEPIIKRKPQEEQ